MYADVLLNMSSLSLSLSHSIYYYISSSSSSSSNSAFKTTQLLSKMVNLFARNCGRTIASAVNLSSSEMSSALTKSNGVSREVSRTHLQCNPAGNSGKVTKILSKLALNAT